MARSKIIPKSQLLTIKRILKLKCLLQLNNTFLTIYRLKNIYVKTAFYPWCKRTVSTKYRLMKKNQYSLRHGPLSSRVSALSAAGNHKITLSSGFEQLNLLEKDRAGVAPYTWVWRRGGGHIVGRSGQVDSESAN